MFLATDYKRAARAFETAVALNPRDAALHNWLGKSYARLAETANPLSNRRYALRAEYHLTAAVNLEPENSVFVRDLFEFYVDSPEWLEAACGKRRWWKSSSKAAMTQPARSTRPVLNIAAQHGGSASPSCAFAEPRRRSPGVEAASPGGVDLIFYTPVKN